MSEGSEEGEYGEEVDDEMLAENAVGIDDLED